MDLDYLRHRQQVELSRANAAATEEARAAHEELARQYEEQIARFAAAGSPLPTGPQCREVWAEPNPRTDP
jgi:hypothetical protein